MSIAIKPHQLIPTKQLRDPALQNVTEINTPFANMLFTQLFANLNNNPTVPEQITIRPRSVLRNIGMLLEYAGDIFLKTTFNIGFAMTLFGAIFGFNNSAILGFAIAFGTMIISTIYHGVMAYVTGDLDYLD